MPKRPGVHKLCAAPALFACLLFPCLRGEDTAPAPQTPGNKPSRAERRAEIEKQIKRLKSEVFAERAEAAETLRGFGAEALPLLTAVEPGDDADYAGQIAQLIRAARLGDGGQFGEAVGALLRGYPNQDATARQQTINQIVRRAGARCVPLLIDLLDNEEDAEVQSLIVSKLSYLSPGADGLKPLLKFYERAPEELKGQVLQALAAIPCDESRKAVREALENGPPSLQAWAVQSVQRLNDRACLPALRKLAAGGEEVEQDLRIEAVNTITGLLDEEAGPLFRKLLDENREIQNAALYGLAGIRDRGAAPLLIQMLKDDSKKELHEQIVDTMGSIGDPSFLPLLKECLHAPAPSMRISAVGALQAMDAREAAGEIDKLLDDADLDVQKYAVDAVAAFRHKESVPKLRKQLGATDEGLRHASAKALACLGETDGLARLIRSAQQYAHALEEGGDQYRSAADSVNSLGSWQSPEAEEMLREMAHDGDETVLWALYQYRFDEEAFRALLRGRLADHLSHPAQIEAELRLATLLSNRGLSALAIKHLESVLRRSPNNAQALDRLASAYSEAGRYAESDAAYARLEALEGVNATFLNNRAWFYCTAFAKEYLRPEPSLTMAQRAVALSPHSTYIVDTLGWANHVSGKYAEALKHLRRAQDLKEGADLPGIAWERTRVARTLAAMGKKDEALAETAKALEEAPRDPRTLVEAAGFYAAMGERDRSVDCLHKAIDSGWIEAPVLELNPEFDALRQDQGYQFALERARRACARMERIVAELEAALLKEHKLKHGDAPAPDEADPDEEEEEVQEGDLFIVE